MRVITGTARGRNLSTLSGEDITRPTSQSTKEALFSAIQFELEGARVIDLFAGSGQLGIEALSRGAGFCTFVENNRDAFRIVEENIAKCKMQDVSKTVFGDALACLSRGGIYDIAFVDPPYCKGLVNQCMPVLVDLMSDDGVIICETDAKEKLPDFYGDWYAAKIKKYGKTKLTYYRKERHQQ